MSKADRDGENPPELPFTRITIRKWRRDYTSRAGSSGRLVGVRYTKVKPPQKVYMERKGSVKFFGPGPANRDISGVLRQLGDSDVGEPESDLLNASDEIRAAAERLEAIGRQLMEQDAFKEAEESLHQALDAARNEAEHHLKQSYLDAMQALPEIQESRLTLLQRAANTRRQLAEVCELRDFKEFARLAPGQIDSQDSNLSRVFSRLREGDGILSVELHGKLLYPAIQIDAESLKIFPEIPPLVKDARRKGYSNWDVLEWLATEQFEAVASVAEKPFDYGTPDDLLEKLEALGELEAAPETGHIPIELLHDRQIDVFNRLRLQWLGN